MSGSYWRQVHAQGLAVPEDRPLAEATAELTALLGDPDPAVREGTAFSLLMTWLERGVYDDLLAGFGDGMAAGLGAAGHRRPLSGRLLAGAIARDNHRPLVAGGRVLDWGDRLATWLIREDDLAVTAAAVTHAADAIGVLAGSPHLSVPELTVLLDVLADRVLAPPLLPPAAPDRLAAATLRVLRRERVPFNVVEPWLARVAAGSPDPGAGHNAQAFLRSLHLQVLLAPQPPRERADLVLVLVAALRSTNPDLLRGT